MGITKAENTIGGQKIELTPEQKAEQKKQDKILLEGYNFQIDNLTVEVEKLEKILKLNLAEREIKTKLQEYKAHLKRFNALKKVIEDRK